LMEAMGFKNMANPLTDKQMWELMQHSPFLDDVAKELPQVLHHSLLNLQKRTGDTYAAGEWTDEKGNKRNVPQNSAPPTLEETKEILGNAYILLDEKKNKLRDLMDKMEISPETKRKNFLEQMIENAKGMFR